MGSNYLRRLEAIEAVLFPPPGRTWHRVIVPIGQTKQNATFAYATAHGLDVGDVQRNVIYRTIVEAPRSG